MKPGNLHCPSCGTRGSLRPTMTYGGYARGEEWIGWECIECFDGWDTNGIIRTG